MALDLSSTNGQSASRKSKPLITRGRTGCLICRERRVRCDEKKPTCLNCQRVTRTCQWNKDIRFVFHQPELEEPQALTTSSATGDSTPARRKKPCHARSVRGSETNRLSSQVHHLQSIAESHAAANSGDCRSPTRGADDVEVLKSVPPDLSHLSDSYISAICGSESARLRDSIEYEHASPIPPNLEPNGEPFSDWKTLKASELIVKALDSDLEMKLMQNYLCECALWFDVQNSQRHFSKLDVPRMINCPPWRAAALALSAKNLELRKGSHLTSESLSLHLYQLSVTLAIDSISGRFDCVGTLAGCVLLAVYEMMTVTYTDWRRHLQGCASIFTHNHWNGSTGGLISASFWNYARIDIWAAYCCSTTTLIHPGIWFDKPDTIIRLSDIDEDLHAQIATWLLARIINLIHDLNSPAPHRQMEEFEDLLFAMARWEDMGSVATKTVMYRDPDSVADVPFPRILFSNSSAVIGHTMFQTGKVLLLEYEAARDSTKAAALCKQIYHHALIACGIVETSNNTACLVSSLQPMWICSRYLKSRSEKFAALEVFAQMERRTGWKCTWRSDSLREMWNIR